MPGPASDSPLATVICGILAGAAGAVAVSLVGAVVQNKKNAPDSGGSDADNSVPGSTAGDVLAEGPDMPPSMDVVTATFVQKVATGIFGMSLGRRQRHVAGLAWHLLYGGFWGGIYALLRSSLRLPTTLIGLLHGLAVWAVGPAWLVPKMKLLLPPHKQEASAVVRTVGVHLIYSAVAATIFRWLRGTSGRGGDEA